MPERDNQIFHSSNKCWVCDKLFDVGGSKARDPCDITGRYRCSGHWSCNINLRLITNVPVIFHSLRGYDSHLIIQEIGKFDVGVSAVPNG